MSTNRINVYNANPEYYSPLVQLDKQLRASALDNTELLLIYIRASQINGCAYCIQLHIKEAIEKGEKQYRIHGLSAWEDTPFYTREEQVILRITEEVTHISNRGITKATYALAKELFSDQKIADIIMAATCINAWNRIGRGTLLEPGKSQE